MIKGIERQLRYNVHTDTGEQERLRHEWTFLLINQPNEISRIEERIRGTFVPSADYIELAEGGIPETGGLHYKAFAFSSDKGFFGRFDKGKIYDVSDKQFKKDRELKSGISNADVWFDNYVNFRLKK